MIEQSTDATPTTAPARRRRLLGVAVLVIFGFAIWRIAFSAASIPEAVVLLSGRIEGDDSAIAPKTGGRISEVRFREGETVKVGEAIAVLDDDQVRAREEQARAAVAVSEARERAARSQLATLQEQLQQAVIQTGQSKTDAEGRVRQADADLAAAVAELAQQDASLQLALFDRASLTKLAQENVVSERERRQAVMTADHQLAVVTAAKRRVEAAEGAVTTARANLANPNIRAAQEAVVRRQIAQQEVEIAAAIGSAQQARFNLAEAQANRRDLTVTAPFDGTVITRAAEPGEVVTAGTTIVTLLDLSKVYLRGFVPEGQIGKVRVRQPARVYLDSQPEQAIEAFVSRADPQATFTPENTYFRDDRVKQVVGVKLQLKSAIGFAKPGMPADGEILVQGDRWPRQQRYR